MFGVYGATVGHMAAKCTKILYESDIVRQFEVYLEEIKGFKEAIWSREKEKESIMARKMIEAAEAAAQVRTIGA